MEKDNIDNHNNNINNNNNISNNKNKYQINNHNNKFHKLELSSAKLRRLMKLIWKKFWSLSHYLFFR